MTSTNAGPTRICPACDARNTNLSLFCAECGASLNGGISDGDTTAFAPMTDRNDAQQTSVFEPESRAFDSGDTTRSATTLPSDRQTAERDYQPYWERSASPASVADQVWAPIDPEPSPIVYDQAQRGGKRGFFLGLIAVFLMLGVFLLWTWASLLDPDARDSIRDFFGFIG